MVREYEDDLFYYGETEADPLHPVSASYEDITEVRETRLDVQPIEDMILEFFR